MKRKALIDGDAVVWRAGFASEHTKNGVLESLFPVAHALHRSKKIIHWIIKEADADKYVIYLSDTSKSNFRYMVFSKYKANRKEVKRPEHEKEIRKYLCKYYNTIIVKGAEVDDALGIEQCKNLFNACSIMFGPEGDEGQDTIICSNDKDLDMIPGWHFDIDWGRTRKTKSGTTVLKQHKKKGIYFVTDPGFIDLREVKKGDKINKKLVGAGQLWFCAQMLLGDGIDGIPSVAKGYGDTKVYNLLKDCKTYEECIKKIWEVYKKEQPTNTIDVFKRNANLLWIKRRQGKEDIYDEEWLI